MNGFVHSITASSAVQNLQMMAMVAMINCDDGIFLWFFFFCCCCCSFRPTLLWIILLCSPCVNAHELFLSSCSQESSSLSRVLTVQNRVLILSTISLFWMSSQYHFPVSSDRKGVATSPCWSEPIPPCSEVEIHVHFVGSVGSAARDRKAISIWLAQIVKVS